MSSLSQISQDQDQHDVAAVTARSAAKQTARELAALAAQSNHPITKLPPEPIPVTRPGHRCLYIGVAANTGHSSRLAESGRLVRRRNRAKPEKSVDLVLLQQKADTVDIGGDRLVLMFHHRRKIELRLAGDDTEGGKLVRGFCEFVRGMEKRLRRNAADVEASAAMRLAFFHDRDLEAELCRPDRADIAAGTGANDDEIVGHQVYPNYVNAQISWLPAGGPRPE